ncbi:MAG: DUF86 domain-containing protein [Patescibacteria group bacterium]
MVIDNAYLRHILEAILKIEQYVAGYTEDSFQNDDLISDGVIRQLEVIGEAAGSLSDEAKSQSREIRWQDATDMRNFLSHEYFRVDRRIVWQTVLKDIPLMKAEVLRLLERQ